MSATELSAEPADALRVDPDPQSLKRRTVHGAAITFVAQGCRFLFQFSSQVALAHLVSPFDFGLIAMVQPIVLLVRLFNDFGLTQATIQRPQITQRELSALFWLNVGASLVLSLLLALASPLVGWFYGQPLATEVTATLAVIVLFSGLAAQQMALLNRRMEFVRLAVIDIAATGLSAAIGVAAAMLGAGYWALVVMQAANSLVFTVLAWTLSGWRPGPPRWERGALRLLRFGGNVTGYNLLNFLSYNMDNVLIGAFSGGAALGLYDRAFRLLLSPLSQVLTPFMRVAVPLLSRLQDDRPLYLKAFARMTQAALLVTTPGLLFAAVMADRIVPLLLGPGWSAAAPIFAALSLGTLVLPVNHGTTWMFISQGRARQQLHLGAITTLLTIASFAAGLPWGPLGVAWAAVASSLLLSSPMQWVAVTRQGPVRLRDLLRIIRPFALGGVASAAALWGLRSCLPAPGFAALGALLAVSYAALLLVLVCFPDGRRALRDAGSLTRNFRRPSM